MAKKQKVGDDKMNKDIISKLPTNLIESILERISINEAARTSILSKNWRYIWASRLDLVLDKPFFFNVTPNKRKNADQFCWIIDKILLVHSGPVKKFVVYIPFAESDMDLWMLTLSRNDIKDLQIYNKTNLRPYKLPSSFFNFYCHQLTSLLLINCELNPPLAFSGFSNLVILSLNRVSISTHTGSLISTLPSLIGLKLDNCAGIENLKLLPPKVMSLGMHHQVLWRCFHARTNLLVLVLQVGKKVQNANQLSLTTLLANSPNLLHLFLDGFSLKFLAAGISPKLYHCCKLTNIVLSHVLFNDLDQVSSALCLLRSSPNLCKLKIVCATVMKDDIAQHDLDNMEATTKLGSLNHLRVVTINCFNGSKAEFLFVKLILSHSCMLRQLIVHSRMAMVAEEELKISRQLMRFHRSSMSSEIIFEQFSNSDYGLSN